MLTTAPTYWEQDGNKIHLGNATDHKKLDSVRRYADVQVARKRALMERGKIIPIRKVGDG